MSEHETTAKPLSHSEYDARLEQLLEFLRQDARQMALEGFNREGELERADERVETIAEALRRHRS